MNNDDFLASIIYAMARKELSRQLNANPDHVKEKLRRKLEFSCTSKITDQDMIKLHIDIALDQGDEETFHKLVKQLEGVH